MTTYSAGLAALAVTLGTDVGLLHDVVHGPASGDGSTVTTNGGSVPTLAKAAADLNAALATWSALTALTGAGSASGDLFIVYDVSAGALKSMTRAELKAAIIDQQLGFTPENAAHRGAANGYASLDSGGLVPTAQLPALAITDVFTVASQAAMLALSAEKGDVAVRTDTSTTYILSTNSPSTLADWKAVAAVGSVSSVAGRTGAVTLSNTDISGLGTAATVNTGTGANEIVKLNGSAQLPAVSGANLTNLPDQTTAAAFKTTASNVNAQTGTSYTLVDGDNGKVVTLSNASAITLTVPSGLVAGFSCTLVQLGAGQVTITASSTTLRNRNGLKLAGQYAQAGLLYLDTNTYSVGGDLST